MDVLSALVKRVKIPLYNKKPIVFVAKDRAFQTRVIDLEHTQWIRGEQLNCCPVQYIG